MFVLNHFLKFNVPEQLLDMNIEEIVALEKEISKLFVGNTKRKIFFGCLSKLGQKCRSG